MKLLSIIVPVYNVEKYIERCVKSCLDQDIPYSDYEIIIVDDGSPDKSIEKVQSLVKKHNYTNVEVIKRKNGGLSAARNTGFKRAKGKYVWFIDSDDYITQNCFSSIAQLLQDEIDIICFNNSWVHDDAHIQESVIHIAPNTVIGGKEVIRKRTDLRNAWAYITRSQFLIDNHLTFVEGIIHEDVEFSPRAWYLAKSVIYLPIVCYHHYLRNGSIMRSNNSKRANNLIAVADALYEFASKNIDESDIYDIFMSRIHMLYLQAFNFANKYSDIKEIKTKKIYPLKKSKATTGNALFKLKFVNLSPYLFFLFNKLRVKVLGLNAPSSKGDVSF